MSTEIERETMDADVLLIGAGPANLACAIRLSQLIEAHKKKKAENPETEGPSFAEPNIFLVEKANEIGQHQLSGAVIDPQPLYDLLPDVAKEDFPFEATCDKDSFAWLTSATGKIPMLYVPGAMHKTGQKIITLSKVAKWLGEHQASAKGIEEHEIIFVLAWLSCFPRVLITELCLNSYISVLRSSSKSVL
jgi:electron-transferring-flavoprotein dehydrogenase